MSVCRLVSGSGDLSMMFRGSKCTKYSLRVSKPGEFSEKSAQKFKNTAKMKSFVFSAKKSSLFGSNISDLGF
jgi:hypothetical protein